jgi:hypothetical protein
VARKAPNALTAFSETKMALKFARGLFRLWLVFSVLWVGGVAITTWRTLPADVWMVGSPDGEPRQLSDAEVMALPQPTPPRPEIVDPFDPTKPYQVIKEKERQTAIQSAVLFAALPPAFILAFGSALSWAFRGFR